MNMNIGQAAAAWLSQLAERSVKEGTVEVYRRDLDKLVEFFGAEKTLAEITLLRINGFVKSHKLLKTPKGKPRAKETLERSKRVCHMFLEWVVSEGHLPDLPEGAINVFKPQKPK